MKLFTALFTPIFVALLLSSCSLFPPVLTEEEVNWQKHRAQVERINAWEISGKMSIKKGSERESFSIDWLQKKNGDYTLYLYGPAGLGAVTIEGTKDKAVLRHPDGDIEARDAGELVEQLTGLDMPMSSLIWWVRGIDNPNFAAIPSLDELNLPKHIRQQSWIIDYEGFQVIEKNKPAMPYKITLKKGIYNAKLIIVEWKI